MLCTNVKRERVRETMDQTQTQRYVPRFEPLALRPRLHREGFLIHYIPTEGTSTEEDLYNREYRTPLLNTTSQPRGKPVAKTTTTPLPKRVTNQTPPLTRESKPITRSTSTKEGYNKSKGVQLGGIFQPQTNLSFSLFHKTKILIE